MSGTNPLTHDRVIELYFLEHRAKLIDIAAFLDRVDRASHPGQPEDYRVSALKAALRLVLDRRGERAAAVLSALSDPTTEPRASAAGLKGAAGAWSEASDGAAR